MGALSIRKDDIVVVRAGKDKGKQGRVLMVMADRGRAIVENIGTIKRHTRPNPQKGIKGGIVEREAAVDISNLMVVCPECSKASRLKRDRQSDGKRVRLCKKCDASVERKAKD